MNKKIGIIGLGYVGLPLAVEFAKKYPVIGFDIDSVKVNTLNAGTDVTLEVGDDQLSSVLKSDSKHHLTCTTDESLLTDCNIYIVTVPTPTDKNHRPVLTPLIKASETIGRYLKTDDIVIYESTVYPGVTEDECVPVLEQTSGLVHNLDFFSGYSPERINPGDKVRTLTNIMKITSGSTPEVAETIDHLYNEIITAGTYKAPSMKVAEAAKVIENSQRDINIAFVNELSMIFNRMDIDTLEVLKAAGTKWNFLPFKPGLVGGHCIGVDPYYLAQKAEEVGYYPEIILAGRRLNDGMGHYVASEIVKLMLKKKMVIHGSRLLMLGITFKENCPDIRNTKAVDVYRELESYGINIDLYDPWASAAEVKETYNINTVDEIGDDYNAVVLTVAHKEFLDVDVENKLTEDGIIYDVKGVLPMDIVNGRL